MNPDGNGWTEYKNLVLYKVDMLEKRIDAIDRKLWGIVAGVVLVGLKALLDIVVRVGGGS